MRKNNKGVSIVELVVIAAVLALLFTLIFSQRTHAKDRGWEKMKFSCYCPESCPGTITATGEKVREGILAASRDHLGDCAMVYLKDGTFLGFYECLDTGGSSGIKNGYVIDVWTPNIEKAKHLMRITEGTIYVEWVKHPAG